ncbi:MAG: hypothetical protein JKY48_01685, partial [Flavobacteriales bacterium]|nr:hypothetical protein [Flavobacteriales bacterium]
RVNVTNVFQKMVLCPVSVSKILKLNWFFSKGISVMTPMEILVATAVGFVVLYATAWLFAKILIILGRGVRTVAPYLLMAFGAFAVYKIFQADAANAATISVPAGVIIASIRASFIGF